MGTGIIQKTRSVAKDKRMKEKKRVLKLDKAEDEDWERYRIKLDKNLSEKLGLESNLKQVEESCISKNIDELWDIISSNIIDSAFAILPSQKISANRVLLKKLRSSDKIQKDLKCLGKICHMCAIKVEQAIDKLDYQQANTEINRLNKKYEKQIEEITEEQWTSEREENLKSWWKVLSKKVQQERKKEELIDI